MLLRSMSARNNRSGTSSQRSGIAPMWSLTARSSGYSAGLASRVALRSCQLVWTSTGQPSLAKKGAAHMMTEDAATVISAARHAATDVSTVSLEPSPQAGLATDGQRMGTNPYHSR